MTNHTHRSQFVLAPARKRHALPYVCCMCLLVLLLIATSLSCSGNKLSRSKATELIRQANHYPDTTFFCINQGSFSVRQYQFQSGVTRPAVQDHWDLSAILDSLSGNGFVKYTWKDWIVTVQLTEKGKEHFRYPGTLGPNSATAIVSVIDFVDVTGMVLESGGTEAQVEYGLKYAYVSPIARCVKRVIRTDGATGTSWSCSETFRKYDDGWRLQR